MTQIPSVVAEGKKQRAEVNGWRVAAMVVQFAGFAVGVFGVGSFAGVNIDAVHKAAAPVAQACVAVPQCNAAIAAGMDTAASAATSAPAGKP